ncbi:O-antigen polymerase [Clostridium perfringens]|nr:O-antigen polymerase [Clostridium perfringens]
MNILLNLSTGILLISILILNFRKKKSKDIFEPVNLYIGIFLVGYVLNNFVLINNINIDKDILLKTQLIELLTILVFFIGYFLISNKKVSYKKIYSIDYDINIKFLILIYIIFWIFRIIGFKNLSSSAMNTNLELTSTKNLESTITIISRYIYYFILIECFKKIKVNKNNKKKYFFIIGTLTFIEIIYGFLGGWKSTIIIIIMYLFMIFNYIYKKIKISKLIIPSIIMIMVLTVVFPLITSYRIISIRNGLNEVTLSNSLKNMSEAIEYTNDNLDKYKTFENLIYRVGYSESLYNVIKGIDKVGYQFGRTLEPVFTFYIPRFLWENKPKSSIGGWYAINFLGWDSDYRSEGAITFTGDIYVNFGILGVIFFMFFYGCLLKYLYIKINPYSQKRLRILIYILFIENFVTKFEQNIANVIISFLFNLIIIITINKFLIFFSNIKIKK